MSLRELKGEPRATVTFSPDGEVLSISVEEPRFSAEDRAVLLASRRAEQEPRGAHGFLMSEAVDPANAYKFRVGDPLTDHAAAALSKAQKAYQKMWPDADVDALLWSVEKVD